MTTASPRPQPTKHNRRPNEELLGKKYMDVWAGIETTEVFRAIRRCMEERFAHQMENEFIFPDGRIGWFELSIQPVAEGVFILSQDITERKRAEEVIRESEGELRALFSAMHDVVIVYDRQGRYLSIAPTDVSLLYKPPSEILGKTLHEVLPSSQADLIVEHIRRALDTQQTVNLDYSLTISAALSIPSRLSIWITA
ncbi:MAG: PAS domain-containing protein [Chloroflexi bacterium]|nr:PAS domain-containing protein [Chloroflexota bacterium]